ncbi:Metallo-beta-lactamase superfamily protein [Sporobacter termitidis DSM 10068]|uniref:Metallo-beta-lactamase superfamily protein n=1 Tax=Sporobacter termitidis DSM 10068 TaxID=1123282 RepID=A0A1M5VDC7_9FIRM|nr:MBL fold metallo-hydrolase [Sporobacter termitidis]SHH72933.1 Metallo-beta-lactamase superfamily protein [Sporobacter termitidis DSM 10068]
MKCKITLTANAGVIVSAGGKELVIDALHCDKVPVFSAVPPEVLDAVWDRYRDKPPDLVLATHAHYDHVSPALWRKARRRWPSSVFIAPVGYLGGTVVLAGQRQTVSLPGITVDAMRLPHDGAKYKLLYHYGYFIDIGGFTVLVPGDCAAAASDMLLELTAGRRTDLALLNFPWITRAGPRAFVRDVLTPVHTAAFHLPFAQDDSRGWRPAAFKAAAGLSPLDVRVLSEPLQEITID